MHRSDQPAPAQQPAEKGIDDTKQPAPAPDAVQSLVEQALAVDDIRQDKVQALRHAIQAGEYRIESDKIADAMIAQSDPEPPE